ncbi:hypothetical protein ACHAWU_008408 [Discostella pseudostelligera]|uniref:Uncharacterized protein n=1 Tax=Discostella pseudostelligera TaxID=259834 RepID=A0ABD3M0X8_9STRA
MLFFSAIRAPLSSVTVLTTGGNIASSPSSSIVAITIIRPLALDISSVSDFLLCIDLMEDSLITLFAIDLVSSSSSSSLTFSTSVGTKSTTEFPNASDLCAASSL